MTRKNAVQFGLLLVAALGANQYGRATEISGGVLGTLTLANSPYIVTGDLTIPAAQSLTIEPGVVLRFNNNVSFFVDGVLTCQGTVNDTIRFTSNSGSANPGDWNGIFFRNSGSGSIAYSLVEFATTGITATGTSPTIANSLIRKNNNGIDCFESATALIQSNKLESNTTSAVRSSNSSPNILRNEITLNSTDGFDSAISCDASSPNIRENVFNNNGNSAIDCRNGSAPQVLQNTLVGNDFGLTLTDASPTIVNNIIAFNEIGINSFNSTPTIKYNDAWSNTNGDLIGTPAGVGDIDTVNANGDSSDVFFNIFFAPQFVDREGNDFNLLPTSKSIDAGDPTNPAGILFFDSAPDLGAKEAGGTLPVELVSFRFEDGALQWRTATETNNLGFEVQRSVNQARPFIAVGFVRGAGTTIMPQNYTFKDASVTHGTYYYRLKQIDTDGSFELSEVVKAVYSAPATFVLKQNYPNPFNPSTTIEFQIPGSSGAAGAQKVTLKLFNTLGQEVLVLLDEIKAPGVHKLRWNGDDKLGRPVASGLYFYRLQLDDQVLIRKMLLSR